MLILRFDRADAAGRRREPRRAALHRAAAGLRRQHLGRRQPAAAGGDAAAARQPADRGLCRCAGRSCRPNGSGAHDLLSLILSWGPAVVYALTHAKPAAAGGAMLIGGLFMVYQYAQQVSGVLGSIAANYQHLARMRTDFASGDVIRQGTGAGAAGPGARRALADARTAGPELPLTTASSAAASTT
ncbi:MAG: hypothetical protein MZW92_74035 [Comamonadaceae bacterium]|nr:hypothetical protein [Comamonadaceae bacterium]